METKLYKYRNSLALGDHFERHMNAMTSEDLRLKTDIACELAWRDQEIERLSQTARKDQQIVDLAVAFMRYVPESQPAAKDSLRKLGEAFGYGWCQAELGKLWEARHDCAPRGRMGVTVMEPKP